MATAAPSRQTVSASILPSGRGFPVASMDAECLALLAYARLASPPPPSAAAPALAAGEEKEEAPRDTPAAAAAAHALPAWLDAAPAQPDAWAVATAALWEAPEGKLPRIVCACGASRSGALGAIAHLESCIEAGGRAGLDSWLDEAQRADCFAWASYTASSLSTLVDLYLYVTPENYYSATRPAYTAFLPWYANYAIPPARRRAAKRRTAHLGLHDALGANAGGDDEPQDSAPDRTQDDAGAMPGVMGRLGLAKKPSREARFQKAVRNMQLDALVGRMVAPLDGLLAGKRYLFSDDRPCSLDAVALGYLKMLLGAEVPDPWAAKLLKEKFPRLVRWCSDNDGFVS